jgi:putative tricarboxylic transport membrane protein
MEIFTNLALGFATAFEPVNLLYCFLGVLLGTLIGVLPGIGPTATIAMLLPITFALNPATSLIMLAGIYYGAQYGGSTTAILINLPGESSSAVTAIDGYQMARQGRAGPALATAALGSFFAGSVATVLIALFAPPLTRMALKFGPAEYFSLMLLGLVTSIALAHGSVLKAIAMIVLGLLLGLAGTDIYTGTPRFTLGRLELADGLNFVAVAVGVFGIAEILRNLENETDRDVVIKKISNLFPGKADLKAIIAPILRGTALGSMLGILPGGGAILSSFAAYSVEKRLSSSPQRFGKGAIEGVAAPESANNAGAQTSFIPMLTLGIPANPVMALMIGAMIIQGITPGPNVAIDEPALFWGVIASMWVGNLMLVLLNLPLIGLWVRLLTIPYYVLFPAILVFSAIGVYSINSNAFDLFAVAVFGCLSYFLVKLGCEPAPLLLGFVLGPMLEENLRRAMIISRGDATVFVTRPISAVLIILAVLVLIIVLLPSVARKREEVFLEDGPAAIPSAVGQSSKAAPR